MGTGKSYKYLNTNGSSRKLSEFALVHAIEGTHTYNPKTGKISRIKSGGHGQKGMDLLKKAGISYNIVKTYPNGVRVGNIPTHKEKMKRTGTGQSWFPASWSKKDIMRAAEHVASLKKNRNIPDGETGYGVYKGVRIGIKRTNGKLSSVFPDSNQNTVLRKHKVKK